MKIFRVILGSLLSVIFGSLVCAALWVLGLIVIGLATGNGAKVYQALGIGIYVLAIGGAFALIAWAAVFVWIYSFVPRTSPLWHTPKCTACGALAGFFIVGIFILAGTLGDMLLPFLAIYGGSGLVTGAATCWFAAVTANHFRPA